MLITINSVRITSLWCAHVQTKFKVMRPNSLLGVSAGQISYCFLVFIFFCRSHKWLWMEEHSCGHKVMFVLEGINTKKENMLVIRRGCFFVAAQQGVGSLFAHIRTSFTSSIIDALPPWLADRLAGSWHVAPVFLPLAFSCSPWRETGGQEPAGGESAALSWVRLLLSTLDRASGWLIGPAWCAFSNWSVTDVQASPPFSARWVF